MTTKTLVIERLSRITNEGVEEVLHFQEGVNVLVGAPNTGKTRWLQMLDFLMGDEGSSSDAFGAELSEKYASALAVMRIGDERTIVERRWKAAGFRSKILVDDHPISPEEFSSFLLDKLNIPTLHFPQGNPFSPRKWPVLSWRSLLRHIYRQSRFWSDLADQQPGGDQRACLMMFLGVAEMMFPPQYEALVDKNKQIVRLEATRDQFNDLLISIYHHLIAGGEQIVDLTDEALERVVLDVEQQLVALMERRTSIVHSLTSETEKISVQTDLDQLSEDWERLQSEARENATSLASAESRLAELQDYRAGLFDAMDKLGRAKEAVVVLADIQVTRCPVCDQRVSKDGKQPGNCFLCGQIVSGREAPSAAREQRLAFEEEQLHGELEEVDGLISAVLQDRDERQQAQQRLSERLRERESQIEPYRHALSMMLPPELARLDEEIGSLSERRRILESLRDMLGMQEDRSQQIDEAMSEARRLEAEIAEIAATLDLQARSDVLADGMNDYLTALNLENSDTWPGDPVRVRIGERTLQMTVGGQVWRSALGDTLRHYFLLSYHYSLMRLSNREDYHYPGITIIDFPPRLEQLATIGDTENYVLIPFVELLERPELLGTQLIAAGTAFEGLPHANRIELTHVWK